MNKFLNILTKPNLYILLIILAVSAIFIYRSFTANDRSTLTQENIYKAEVTEVISTDEHVADPIRGNTVEQQLKVKINRNGEETLEVLNDLLPVGVGDEVYIQIPGEEDSVAYVLDIYRTRGLFYLTLVFVILVALISGRKGIYSLVGLAFSFVVIFSFMIPRILANQNPVLISILGALFILVVSLYVTYGFNRQSLTALAGILIALVVVGLLSTYVVSSLNFSGFNTEEAVYLNSQTRGALNLTNLLIAGILIAIIGILDDVAVTQASAVFGLSSVSKNLKGKELFKKAMELGRDHISAVINTLVLAYTGAALPLLLLLSVNKFPVIFTLNGEILANEIVRTLISSMGLVLAIPATTLIAVFLVKHNDTR